MIYFALVATLWRATSKYWNDVYHYEECWFAAVSCMCLRDFQLFRWWIVCTSSQLFCYGGTRWWNILTLSYEQQRCHSSITSDWWTSYICELSVTGWTASSRHWYGLRSEVLLLQRLLVEHFSSSVHHLPHFQPGRRTFIISSLVSTKTSISSLQLELWIVIDNISSQLWETV